MIWATSLSVSTRDFSMSCHESVTIQCLFRCGGETYVLVGLGERVVGHVETIDGRETIGGKGRVRRDEERGWEVLSSCQSTGWIKPRATRRAFNFLRGASIANPQLGMAPRLTCIQPSRSSDSDFSVGTEHPLDQAPQNSSKLSIVIVCIWWVAFLFAVRAFGVHAVPSSSSFPAFCARGFSGCIHDFTSEK